jgi:predicted enzyme related to lactoylglutathione lyase
MAAALQIREVQVRRFVPADRLRETVAHYKALTGGRCTLHFRFPERGLELASVSSPAVSFLIIAGDESSLERFRETKLTILVDDIEAAAPALAALGAEILQPVTPVPTGFQTRARHPDGLVVEYVQHTGAADRFRATEF